MVLGTTGILLAMLTTTDAGAAPDARVVDAPPTQAVAGKTERLRRFVIRPDVGVRRRFVIRPATTRHRLLPPGAALKLRELPGRFVVP